MPLRFVDDGGNEGWIDDDLTVRYVGGIDVDGAVEEIVDDGMTVDEALNELIVQLPRDRPITAVQREDGTFDGPSDSAPGARGEDRE